MEPHLRFLWTAAKHETDENHKQRKFSTDITDLGLLNQNVT
jgi:hypothetical protein